MITGFSNVRLEISDDRSRATISATRRSPREEVFIVYRKDENGNVEPVSYFKGIYDLHRDLSRIDQLRFDGFKQKRQKRNKKFLKMGHSNQPQYPAQNTVRKRQF
jgi:hypothetical protein